MEVGGASDTWLPPIIIAGLLPTLSPASCHGWLAFTPLHFLNYSPEPAVIERPAVATVRLSLTRRLKNLPECRQPSMMMGSVSGCVDSGPCFPLDLLNHLPRSLSGRGRRSFWEAPFASCGPFLRSVKTLFSCQHVGKMSWHSPINNWLPSTRTTGQF